MREGVGHDIATGLFLQPVVADGKSGVERRFNVSCLQVMKLFLRVVGPDAGQEIGLQFKTNRRPILIGVANVRWAGT